MSTNNVHTDPTAIGAMEEAASHEHLKVQSDGSVVGYKAGRTLRIRVELARQLRRRRTQLMLGLLVLLPVVLVVAFQIGQSNPNRRQGTFVDLAVASAPNFVVFALFVSGTFLLPMIVAIFFGDTIASEASWSSLKYLLATPIPRHRLIAQKAMTSGILSLFALLLLPSVSLLIGVIWYGAGEAVSPTGDAVSFGDGVTAIYAATIYIAINLLWVAALALFLSVSTDAPLGAVGGTVLVAIVSQILDQITALEDLRNYLPTHYAFAWSDLISTDIDWSEMTRGAFSAVCFAAFFGFLAVRKFTRKDITS
ncbi:ABC transporter permease [Kibdelosporangium phytohabitans]|uniref:ABC transporter permease n=1 Tax=Kibdelosporangium phytohabitans TaxID=860235 RepID=A0A0N9ICI9_9PSEU|nr:ABC transporter permease [Kibdelosporangium phytohabitans]ALG12420.1 ABC transporter permease [Kibdelosporangium phytohabitans]MBE1464005.1 ABC-2 type transport system permease protein [Kibdelosporangium phytohabitans]